VFDPKFKLDWIGCSVINKCWAKEDHSSHFYWINSNVVSTSHRFNLISLEQIQRTLAGLVPSNWKLVYFARPQSAEKNSRRLKTK
jgi:hypothetical protein